jgi:cell division protein FtsL
VSTSTKRARRAAPGSAGGAALGMTGLELLVAAALVAALGVFHVLPRVRIVSAGYALSALQGEHARLVATQDQLKIELGMLTAPAELARRAKLSRLGMAPPDRGAVWAEGPRQDGADRAGVDGVVHASRPAEPARFALAASRPPRGP